MRVYKLQKFRGGFAIATYEAGQRISRRQLLATDHAEAGREFDRIVAEANRPERVTVRDVWERFRHATEGRRIAEAMGFEARAVLAHFGDMEPESITVDDCRKYTAKRRGAEIQDGTIWTELGHLRTALNWAMKARLIENVPQIERPSKPKPKNRYLTRDEAERLIAAATMPHVKAFIALAITTAARTSALLELTWARCDLERGLIDLSADEVTARRKGRAVVPMNDLARAVLSEAKTGARTPYVIEWAGQRVQKVRKGIATAATRANLADVTPHVFRHTAAVWMAENGVPMAEIAQYLGHSDSRVTERVYARFSPDYLRKAAGALEFGKVRAVT